MIRRGPTGRGRRLGVLAGVVVAAALVPSPALGALSISQTGSPDTVRKGNEVTYTITVSNTGSSVEEAHVYIVSYQVDSEKTADNPYASVVPTQGTCELVPNVVYHAARCTLGSVNPGTSAQIVASATVNEDAEHNANLDLCPGSVSCQSPFANVTTLVEVPPDAEGSKKIKVKGLPDGCADRDLKLTATAKGAKKISGAWHGPLVTNRPELDRERGGLGPVKGEKLKDSFPAGQLPPGLYEIRLTAKYEGKPKQKTTVLLQRCGNPYP